MSFRAWGYRQNKVYARVLITASQVNAIQPAGFLVDGQCIVYNSGSTDVLFHAWVHSAGDPTLAFPADGSPPTGSVGTVIPKGARVQVSINVLADSFGAIGSAAGPSLIYVQRGTGSV